MAPLDKTLRDKLQLFTLHAKLVRERIAEDLVKELSLLDKPIDQMTAEEREKFNNQYERLLKLLRQTGRTA